MLARLLRTFPLFLLALQAGCSSMATIKVDKHKFPAERAFVGEPKRPYDKLGLVRTKVEYPSLNPDAEEEALCLNYYNKAVEDLVKRSRDQGGDAVMQVRSVVFLVDGRTELHETPECADDGEGGQVLAEAIAIKWKPDPAKAGPELAAPPRAHVTRRRRRPLPAVEPESGSSARSQIVRPGDAPVIRGN